MQTHTAWSIVAAAWEGNVHVDPLFVDADGGDLRLSPDSPVIDAGDTSAIEGGGIFYPTDHDGQPRAIDAPHKGDRGVPLVGHTTDMGAFEFQPDSANACPADFDGDGEVRVADLVEFVLGTCS